jgi:hypothetical protein
LTRSSPEREIGFICAIQWAELTCPDFSSSPLTAEQIAAQAEAVKRDRQRKPEWAAVNEALRDDSMTATRTISRSYSGECETKGVMTRFEDGCSLSCVLDRDLAVVLLDLRRRLIDEYGKTPAATMLID